MRYRIVDSNPYLDREDEYRADTIEGAVGQAEELTGVPADLILSDLGTDRFGYPWEWIDPETGREVTLRPEAS